MATNNACPMDYPENTKLAEKLEHLSRPSELGSPDNK